MHTCVHTNRYGWMVFTCWTSHLCSVEMETGHCCWSRSWHRHSARTKWRRSPINQDKRREKREPKVGRGRFRSEVLTAIYVSYCVSGVAALIKVSLSFFVCQRSGISACCDLYTPPPPPPPTHTHLAHVYLLPHSHEEVLKLWPDSNEEQAKTAKVYWPSGGTLWLLQSGAGH